MPTDRNPILVDAEVIAAVRASVASERQPAEVADRLIAWLAALASGQESIAQAADCDRRFDVVAHALRLPEDF